MTTKITLVLCLIGAIGSLMIGFGGLGWSLMSIGDALIFPLVIGPYAVFAGLTLWRRSNPVEVRILLVSVILVAAYGFWAFGLSLYRRLQMPDESMAMNLSALVVPALQWVFTCVIFVIVGVMAFIKSRRQRRRPV